MKSKSLADLKERAAKVFAANPGVETLHVSEDGNCFTTEVGLKAHIGSAKVTVHVMVRGDLAKLISEVKERLAKRALKLSPKEVAKQRAAKAAAEKKAQDEQKAASEKAKAEDKAKQKAQAEADKKAKAEAKAAAEAEKAAKAEAAKKDAAGAAADAGTPAAPKPPKKASDKKADKKSTPKK